ncbi:MAG: 16S rRNA (cytosine(1402)-N(4))-methyltransferase RsmH [Acidobacteria bacterium]|nr:16S rRNA (cytosine(1402)-N(4))-methyltransferase RsmH [Acidobacteriota bacterium]
MPVHVPVMTAEVLTLLRPERGGFFVDCTAGLGGHMRALLQAGADRQLGIDRDAEALAMARERLAPWGDRVEFVHADYRDIAGVLEARGIREIDGALADLGVSSLQLESERGFSFQRDEPLDMRMDRGAKLTAAEAVNTLSERELADVIYRYGEERHSRRVARRIVEARARRPVRTTFELAAIVRRAVPRGRQRIDPATRTFQALRIWVNRELDHLDRFLRDVAERLKAGGRMVVISFHSLEDRVVKQTFRALERGPVAMRILTKKPLRPQGAEVSANPRARSARLRAAERVPVSGMAAPSGSF